MKSDLIVCRCEEVTYSDLIEVAKKYSCSSRELKLRTRAGMGYCSGRVCRSLIEMIVANETKDAKQSSLLLKYQPPVRPVSFVDLGGDE